ncbi:hypothetical protein J6500_07215 [Bradyrhizobium sp. WSM 1704]|uniref:hypothetical protein n=1 Tax=Bradyrhizobium semiaridum TaxID=2821404 RepID=UPI001CE29818|nr:hypothetical protein [Bradyrhizobium semiaridum]MCA6121690.1 hypothetical protein [Bradyrhizobium semiaridum]
MTAAQFLIRASEKILGHYQFLLDTAKSEHERETYAKRIEQERRILDRLLAESDQPARAA